MSVEAFVTFFQNGAPATVSHQAVRSTFGQFLTQGGGFDWHLHYDGQNDCDVMLTKDDADPSMIQGFTVMRPCADIRLWDSLASALRLGNGALFFSWGAPLLIADSGVVQHLPEGMTEGSLGKARSVASGSDILREIHDCSKGQTA